MNDVNSEYRKLAVRYYLKSIELDHDTTKVKNYIGLKYLGICHYNDGVQLCSDGKERSSLRHFRKYFELMDIAGLPKKEIKAKRKETNKYLKQFNLKL